MHLLLVTGFLGSGKTTLILGLARAARAAGRRTAIIVNEIGEIGIDNQLMRQLDLDVWELFNGCICCTLTADLVGTLEKLDAAYAPDLVVVEPSGAADPSNLLRALPYYHGRPLAGIRWVAVLDPQRLPMLLEVLTPLITSGIRQADCLVVSKTDIATPDEVSQAVQAAREINSAAPLFCEALGGELAPALAQELLQHLAVQPQVLP
jgi:G3E family GTPase